MELVAGSRGKDLLQTDLNGAIKVMQAAEQSGATPIDTALATL